MTTERIDVLAVMEASAKRLRLGVEGPANADALDEARASVAELAAAARLAITLDRITPGLIAALARVVAP